MLLWLRHDSAVNNNTTTDWAESTESYQQPAAEQEHWTTSYRLVLRRSMKIFNEIKFGKYLNQGGNIYRKFSSNSSSECRNTKNWKKLAKVKNLVYNIIRALARILKVPVLKNFSLIISLENFLKKCFLHYGLQKVPVL